MGKVQLSLGCLECVAGFPTTQQCELLVEVAAGGCNPLFEGWPPCKEVVVSWTLWGPARLLKGPSRRLARSGLDQKVILTLLVDTQSFSAWGCMDLLSSDL